MKIEKLELPLNIQKKLDKNKIILFNDLWTKNRQQLKEIGFDNDEINLIIVKLQLNGYDLKKKEYK